jgi:virulence factor Mce-like protein
VNGPLSNTRFRVRRGRRRDTEPPARSIAKGLLVTGLIAGLVWLAVTAYNGVPFRSYSTMYVSIPKAGNLLQHDPVRIAGVRVGQVLQKGIGRDGSIRLKLQLEPGVSLPADTTVALRASGLLGARYVELIPGRSTRPLAAGSTIRAPLTALTYGVPEALDTLDAQTRGQLGNLVTGLGTGLLGRGLQLNNALRLSGPDMIPFEQLTQTILARPGAAQRLLPSVDQMTTALARARTDIARSFGPAATALAPFVVERSPLRGALEAAPSALTAAQSGLSDGQRLLSATQALAQAARTTLPAAPAGLRATTALLRDSHPALVSAGSLLRAAQPAIPAALQITGSLQPVLAPLGQGLDNLTTMANQVAPYGCNIINLGAVFRSMTGYGGTGEGPNGPAMAFRLMVVPSGLGTLLGAADSSGLATRDGYPPPCKYLASTYPIIGSHYAGRAGH